MAKVVRWMLQFQQSGQVLIAFSRDIYLESHSGGLNRASGIARKWFLEEYFKKQWHLVVILGGKQGLFEKLMAVSRRYKKGH